MSELRDMIAKATEATMLDWFSRSLTIVDGNLSRACAQAVESAINRSFILIPCPYDPNKPEEKLYRALTATVLNDTMERCADIINRKVEELMNGAADDVDTLSQHDRLTSMAG